MSDSSGTEIERDILLDEAKRAAEFAAWCDDATDRTVGAAEFRVLLRQARNMAKEMDAMLRGRAAALTPPPPIKAPAAQRSGPCANGGRHRFREVPHDRSLQMCEKCSYTQPAHTVERKAGPCIDGNRHRYNKEPNALGFRNCLTEGCNGFKVAKTP